MNLEIIDYTDDLDLVELGFVQGDEVLISGVRYKYPYKTTYHATKLMLDSEGCLYPYSVGEINYHRIEKIAKLTGL